MASLRERFKRSYNAFMERDSKEELPNITANYSYGGSGGYRPGVYLSRVKGSELLAPIYNKLAVEVSMYDFQHVLLDEDKNFKKTVDDYLNQLLTCEANIDQNSRAWVRDICFTMFETGVAAAAIIESYNNPDKTDSFVVSDSRVGVIKEWLPKHVRVEVYNENTGKKEILLCDKRVTPIFENPFYMVMNEPNGTVRRLLRILSQLDRTNENNSAGKIDMLIQLPYSTRTKVRKEGAEARRKELEDQLAGSQYGIGYIDSSEKVIQLNRSIENDLWNQAKELWERLYKELGVSPALLDGTAKEEEILNFQNSTVKPIVTSICEELTRKWISKTSRTQGHCVKAFSDPFRLVAVNNIADIADTFTRNEIMTSNELRTKIGLKPSDDPKADQLLNSNLNHPEEGMMDMQNEVPEEGVETVDENGQNQQDFLTVDDILGLT